MSPPPCQISPQSVQRLGYRRWSKPSGSRDYMKLSTAEIADTGLLLWTLVVEVEQSVWSVCVSPSSNLGTNGL